MEALQNEFESAFFTGEVYDSLCDLIDGHLHHRLIGCFLVQRMDHSCYPNALHFSRDSFPLQLWSRSNPRQTLAKALDEAEEESQLQPRLQAMLEAESIENRIEAIYRQVELHMKESAYLDALKTKLESKMRRLAIMHRIRDELPRLQKELAELILRLGVLCQSPGLLPEGYTHPILQLTINRASADDEMACHWGPSDAYAPADS